MNTVVWEFPLEVTDSQTIRMPGMVTPLAVQWQASKGGPCLWARVCCTEPETDVEVITVGTGHPMPDRDMEYVGTYQTRMGLVFHVFFVEG